MIDSEHGIVPGSREASDVLNSDPLFRLSRRQLTRPWVLGMALFVLVVAMIVFGPSTESRFIYTDF
jgi:hypothetical protein